MASTSDTSVVQAVCAGKSDEGTAQVDDTPLSKNVAAEEAMIEKNSATTNDVPKSSDKPQEKNSAGADEREQFSGFRIVNRCRSAAEVAQVFQDVRVIRISRVAELGKRANYNRILIGLLCDWRTSKFANGEMHIQLVLTDLAEPLPKRIHVHLRRKAFEHWRKEQVAKPMTRASIIALMNPVLVDAGSRDALAIVRVEDPAALEKLGDCPSLGLCAMKNCKDPCNVDLKDRFCKMHLHLNYANKVGRSATGGMIDSTLKLVASQTAPKRKWRAPVQEEVEELDEEAREAAKKESMKKRMAIATALPMSFEERRIGSSEARQDYFRSIRLGTKATDNETSRVPKMGRSIDEAKGIELDTAAIKVDEKCKLERLLNRMVEKRAERYVAQNSASMIAETRPAEDDAARSRKRASAALEKKKSLGVLHETLKVKREPRRAEIAAQKCGSERQVSTSSLEKDGLDQRSEIQADQVNDEEAAMGLLSDLKNAGEDCARIKAVLQAADRLPISVLEGEQGSRFFSAVGNLAMHPNNPEIRRAALIARRRWRAVSDEKHTAAQRKAAKSDASELTTELKITTEESIVEPLPCSIEARDESTTLMVTDPLPLTADVSCAGRDAQIAPMVIEKGEAKFQSCGVEQERLHAEVEVEIKDDQVEDEDEEEEDEVKDDEEELENDGELNRFEMSIEGNDTCDEEVDDVTLEGKINSQVQSAEGGA